MRQLTQYVCEKCGTVYADQKKCEQCEKTHKDVQAVAQPKYIPYGNDHTGYPLSVTVYFTDGSKAIYKR